MKAIFFEKPPLYAFLICSSITLVMNKKFWEEKIPLQPVIFYLYTVIAIALGIAIIRFMTEGIKKSGKVPYTNIPLNTWGYIWRYLISMYLSLILMGLTVKLIPMLNSYFITTLLIFGFYTLLIFLFFCKNKKEKLKTIIGSMSSNLLL